MFNPANVESCVSYLNPVPAFLRSGQIVLDVPTAVASVACLRATAVADSTLGGSASVTLSAGLFTSTDKDVVAPATTSGACNPAAAVAAITGYFSAAAAVGASLGLDGIVVVVAVAYSCDAAFIGVGIRRVVVRGCCSGGEP